MFTVSESCGLLIVACCVEYVCVHGVQLLVYSMQALLGAVWWVRLGTFLPIGIHRCIHLKFATCALAVLFCQGGQRLKLVVQIHVGLSV